MVVAIAFGIADGDNTAIYKNLLKTALKKWTPTTYYNKAIRVLRNFSKVWLKPKYA